MRKKTSGAPELREALADDDRLKLEVLKSFHVVGVADGIAATRKRLRDLEAGRPAGPFSASTLCRALHALGRRDLARTVWSAGGYWQVDASGSYEKCPPTATAVRRPPAAKRRPARKGKAHAEPVP